VNFRFAHGPVAPILGVMRRSMALSFFLLLAGVTVRAEPEPAAAPTTWDKVTVAPMKTSIYIGSVKLTTGVFVRHGSTLSTTYEASVVPWFFWNESGQISITLDDSVLAKLAKGETAEFKGDGINMKNKPRPVTGRAQPADAFSGKIKVRVNADGVELIFNGTYRFSG